eukprot:scaffold116_cov233-Pinguiococcus_pyrenoidosus.AAC.12
MPAVCVLEQSRTTSKNVLRLSCDRCVDEKREDLIGPHCVTTEEQNECDQPVAHNILRRP